TPEALAHRPGWGPGFFVGKMKMDEALMHGLSLEELIARMDGAGISHGFLIAHKSGRPGLPGCYHLPYKLVADAVAKHPDRFHGLAGVDPFMGMAGVRSLESAIRDEASLAHIAILIGSTFRPTTPNITRSTPNARSLACPISSRSASR